MCVIPTEDLDHLLDENILPARAQGDRCPIGQGNRNPVQLARRLVLRAQAGDGGKVGVQMGIDIVPGVLVICTFVMMLSGGPADGPYDGCPTRDDRCPSITCQRPSFPFCVFAEKRRAGKPEDAPRIFSMLLFRTTI